MKVKQSGHIGDLVYSLSATKKVAEISGNAVDFYVGFTNPNTVVGHPSGNFTMNTEGYNYIKPLLEYLPFIKSVQKHNGETIDYDFDKFRDFRLPVHHYDLRKWHTILYPELQVDLSERVIPEVERLPYIEGKIVINLTNRYRTPLDYMALRPLADRLVFVGLDKEHESFMFGFKAEVKRVHVKDALHMAKILNTCDLFIGNQSSTFAIAEQMKINRALEVYLNSPNVITVGNSYEYCTQQGLNNLVKKWI